MASHFSNNCYGDLKAIPLNKKSSDSLLPWKFTYCIPPENSHMEPLKITRILKSGTSFFQPNLHSLGVVPAMSFFAGCRTDQGIAGYGGGVSHIFFGNFHCRNLGKDVNPFWRILFFHRGLVQPPTSQGRVRSAAQPGSTDCTNLAHTFSFASPMKPGPPAVRVSQQTTRKAGW